MRRAIFLVVIFLSCYGCEKDDSTHYSSSLIGKWSWLRTCGGFVGCVGPEIEHINVNLIITADSIYHYYQNDTLKMSVRFHTYKLISLDGKDSTNIIKFDSGGSDNFSITHDTLG